MKKKFRVFLFIGFLILGFTVGTTSSSAIFYKFCTIGVGQFTACNNVGTGENGLTKFSNTLSDSIRGTSAYVIKHEKGRFIPTVYRGTPYYSSYVVNDNKNGYFYQYSQVYGKFLNDYPSGYTVVTGKSLGFHPTASESPTTNLYIKSGTGLACKTQPWDCLTYTHASDFKIN